MKAEVYNLVDKVFAKKKFALNIGRETLDVHSNEATPVDELHAPPLTHSYVWRLLIYGGQLNHI